MTYRRPNADERLRRLIDEFNTLDQITKRFDRERELLRRKLRNIIRRRGRGYYNGNESSIHAYDVARLVLSADRVREVLPRKVFDKCFKKSKYIQLDGGPLLPDNKVLPDMGPPVEL